MPDLPDPAAFRARPPWHGADLQTLRNTLRLRPERLRAALAAYPARRLELPLPGGDRLVAELALPRTEAGDAAPRILVLHGLTGCAESLHVMATAATLLARGHAVQRLNLRGAGASRPLCRGEYHAGRSEDLRAAIAGLAAVDQAPAAAVGYSLGGNVLLKYLGEEGAATPLRAAAAVSAPIDLADSAARFHQPRNRLYRDWLLRRMRAEIGSGWSDLPAELRSAAASARSVHAFDDQVMAPRHGFRDAADYYARCSALGFLQGIRVPTLVVHALDDPWIGPEAYLRVDWRANPALVPLLTPGGGHVGFHDVGAGPDRTPWHDRAIAAFLAQRR